jgi:lipopolysaccharide assembly outer membrane protein LptD (OstA)
MRKILIVALVILGAAITGDAQDGPKGTSLPPGSKVSAQRVEKSKGDVLFSGNVAVSIPGATVTADSVIFRQGSQTYELEGHVQLKVNPPAK